MSQTLADKRRSFVVEMRKEAVRAMIEERRRKLIDKLGGTGKGMNTEKYGQLTSEEVSAF